MSKSLLKKGLELVYREEESYTKKPSNKRKREKRPMDLISTNRSGVKKELRKLKQNELKRRRERKIKAISLTDNTRQKTEEDMTEVNLEVFQRLSNRDTKNPNVEKIIEHHKGKLAKDTYVPTTKAPEVRSILFHDRDFDIEQTHNSNDDFWK